MSESPAGGQQTAAETTGEGRYLYCLVEPDPDDESTPLDISGIGSTPVSLVTATEVPVGALVHDQGEPFDSTDLSMLRDWLLAHQQVVDAAGEWFGTPLPVRFDTIIQGGDDSVSAWLDANAGQITGAFDDIRGCWEYRVTLLWDSTQFEADQRESDSELSDITRRMTDSGDGTQFLLEKQYNQRLRALTRTRRAELEQTLVDQIEHHGERLSERPVQSDAAASLGIDIDSDAIAQVAVLAPPTAESALGATLDSLTERPGVEVRFTGPWPPYTFAPEISDDG